MAQLLSALPVGALVKDTGTVYNGESPIFRVLEHGHTGDPSNSTTLEFRDVISVRCFDAKEPNNSINDRKTSGNNRYSYSNLLQWLNSNASAGNWYTAKHTDDQIPSSSYVVAAQNTGVPINPYDSDAGFLSYFSASLKNILQTVTKLSHVEYDLPSPYTENVESKMFLLSIDEVGLSSWSKNEGTVYSYYDSNVSKVKYVKTSAAIGTYPFYNVNDAASWWLRTTGSHSGNTRYVNYDGTVMGCGSFGSNSTNAPGVSPAFCIPQSTLVSDTADSDGVYTLILSSPTPSSTKIISLEGLDTFKDCMEDVIDDKISQAGITTYSLSKSGNQIILIGSDGSESPVTDDNTTYESKTASSGGTDVSLVTTGEKYTWNNKSDFSGSYDDLSNKPTLGTAAAKNIPASGNAASTEVVLGSDTRLARGNYFGTCTGQAANQKKAVVIPAAQNFVLEEGAVIFVKFDAANTYSATADAPVMLNVNSTGNKQIYWAATAAQTGTSTTPFGRANYINQYVYDGTYWVWAGSSADNDANTDTKVTQTVTTTNATYEVLFSASTGNSTKTEAARKNNNLTFNPSTGNLQATQLNGVTIGSSPKFTDTTYSTATTSANGLMSSTDKTKLEGIGTISNTYIDNLFT